MQTVRDWNLGRARILHIISVNGVVSRASEPGASMDSWGPAAARLTSINTCSTLRTRGRRCWTAGVVDGSVGGHTNCDASTPCGQEGTVTAPSGHLGGSPRVVYGDLQQNESATA